MKLRRLSFLSLAAVAAVAPGVAAAANAAKVAFIASCDESISISRLAGAPYKFTGKHVDLRGYVGAPAEGGAAFNLVDDDGRAIIAVHDARQLEMGQAVRVLAVVGQGEEFTVQGSGGSTTFAVVNVKYME
jgi:hypothetical protein